MKKIFKPFWSFNIKKTEQWLSEMASEGYILKDINKTSSIFIFEKTKNTDSIYKICYEDKLVNDISPSLKKEGWKCLVKIGGWLFISNEKTLEEIKLKPIRQKLIKRNRFINKIILPIMILYGATFLPMFIFLTILWASFGASVSMTSDVESIIMLYFNHKYQSMLFVVFAFGLYSYIKLKNVNKEIRAEDNIFGVEIEEDNDLSIEENKLIKRIKVNWFYNQEKTIHWLNDMESRGYHLCKVNKYGTKFYFIEDKPRKIKYVIDYQSEFNLDYYEIYKEDGWKLRYKSIEEYDRWCLWSKEYEDIEPEIYTQSGDMIEYSKKLLVSHTVRFVPLILCAILLIYSSIDREEKLYLNAMLYALMALQYIKFYLGIVGYYLREKKKLSDCIR